MSPVRRNFGPISLYGTGFSHYGHRAIGNGDYRVTTWITVLYLPLLPVSTWIIRPVRERFVNLGSLMGENFVYQTISRERLDWRGASRTYLAGYFAAAIALVPLTLMAVFDSKPTGTEREWFIVALWMASAIWMLIPIWILNRRQERIFEEAEKRYQEQERLAAAPRTEGEPSKLKDGGVNPEANTKGAWVVIVVVALPGAYLVLYGQDLYFNGILPGPWLGWFLIGLGLFFLSAIYWPHKKADQSPTSR